MSVATDEDVIRLFFFPPFLRHFKGNELSVLLKQRKENHQAGARMLTRPQKAKYCWRGLNISPLCWRSWMHPTAGLCQFPGRGQADAVGLIWKAKAPPWLEVVRLKAAVSPPVFLRCRRFSSETNGALSSVIFAVSFAEPPQERQTRQQQKSSSPDRQKVRFFFPPGAVFGRKHSSAAFCSSSGHL